MKIINILFFLCLLTQNITGQHHQADDIVGTWLTASKEGYVHIYKNSGRYYATSTPVDGSEDFKYTRDVNNIDENKRNNLMSEVLLLKDFVYQEDDKWSKGTLYDPRSGKSYSAYITMLDINKIKVTGYIGFTWLAGSENWTRVR